MQDPSEQSFGDGDLRELECDKAAVAHDLGADLDQLLAPSQQCPLRVICGHAAAVRVWSASIMKADLIAAGPAAGVPKGTDFRTAGR